MTALALLLALTAPYQNVTLADGSTASYDVSISPQAAPGQWAYSLGPLPSPVGSYQQALTVGDRGWNDTSLRMTATGLQTSRYNDPAWDISAPWRQNGAWAPAYVRVWAVPPIGASNGEVWPKAGLTIRTSNSRVTVESHGSPSESLRIVGNNNTLAVYAFSGEQSRLMLNRPAVHVEGSRNTISGYAEHPLCALYIKGTDNWIKDFTAVGGEVGDDTGLVYVDSTSARTRLTNVVAIARQRKYPVSHGQQGFYLDDKVSNCTVTDCTAYGFQRGAFVHGGNNNAFLRFKSPFCASGVVIAPWFKTPNVQPQGNTVRE